MVPRAFAMQKLFIYDSGNSNINTHADAAGKQ